MWPEPVERVAAFLRRSAVQGRLEELPQGVDTAPGPELRAAAFACDGRSVVVLVPSDRAIDAEKLALVARCRSLIPAPVPAFPFQYGRVFVDQSVLPLRTVWLEAGSPRHVLAIAPGQLTRLIRAETADLVREDEAARGARRGHD
jgi:prolyl-tRNA editing enzyme YbaK/EbsC (Cys-tRNA(Pro) deacylase)